MGGCLPINNASSTVLVDETDRLLSSPSRTPAIEPQRSAPSRGPGTGTSQGAVSLKRNAELPKGAPSKEPYYCGRISTRKAEDQLKHTQRLDGTFLIRDCEVVGEDGKTDFVLSMMKDGVVYHLDINRGEGSKYFLGDIPSAKSFSSVAKLVAYYQKKTIDLAGGGSVLLKYYLPTQ